MHLLCHIQLDEYIVASVRPVVRAPGVLTIVSWDCTREADVVQMVLQAQVYQHKLARPTLYLHSYRPVLKDLTMDGWTV